MLRPAHSKNNQILHFADDYFDLSLETDRAGNPRAFQLCYNLISDEHALTWSTTGPTRHLKVDQGEDKATINRAPILVADGECPVETLTREFSHRSKSLPPETQEFILSKIREACD